MHRSQVFLAELLRGIEQLQIRDVELVRHVLRMLGLDHLEAPPEALRPEAAAPPRPGPTAPPPKVDVAPPAPAPAPLPAGSAQAARLERRSGPVATPALPDWLAGTVQLPRPAGLTPPSRGFEPLFPPAQTRGLLTAMLGTLEEDGPLDIPRVVEELARLQPLRELPRERQRTLRRGAQVLLDTGLAMAPFGLDVDALRAAIGRLLAPAQGVVWLFAGTPLRGCVAEGSDRWHARWPAPAPGTPVLVVTDLGIGRPAAGDERAPVDEWLAFFEAARAGGGPVTALVPYGLPRWPRALRGAARIVHWDRRTTAAMVHHVPAATGALAR